MKYGSTYTLNGREYRLLYTADAYFDINEAMGEDFHGQARLRGA